MTTTTLQGIGIIFNVRHGTRLTAILIIVEKVAVSVPEEFINAQRCRRFQTGDIVVFIDTRSIGIEALKPAVGLIATGEDLRADAGAFATISVVIT